MRLSRMMLLGTVALAMCLSANNGLSQENQNRRERPQGGPGGGGGFGGERPNFDPAQMRERMMERYKETLEITDDAEWNAIKPKIEKVTEARMASFTGGMGRGMFGGRRGGDQGGDRNAARPGGFGTPNPEVETLQKAVDAKASNAELKAALEKAKEARKAKQAELEKAQEDLRKLLTPRQEALAMLNGLL